MTHPLTDLLLAHRASGVLLENLPADLVPADAEEAYRVQTESVRALGPVGAWKVQPFPESGEPFASPILASTVFQDGVELKLEDFPGIAVESEIAVTIDRDLPGKTAGYTASDLREAVGMLHIALEIISSRFLDRQKIPALVGIADLQNSGAVIVGPDVSAARLPEFGQQAISLEIDGTEVKRTAGNGTTENTLTSLAWLANHAAARGLPLTKGVVVITGARIGPLPLTGKHVSANAPGLGAVSGVFA